MPTSPYFNSQLRTNVSQEKRVLEDLFCEIIKIYGVNVYYIPREAVSMDWVYGEDPLTKFIKNYGIEMYWNSPLGYEGLGNLFSKFNLEIRDDASFIVSRRSFIKYVPTQYNRVRGGPREGDLIWYPLNHALFEIKKVEGEEQFYTLGNEFPYYYSLTCERFRYNNERFETGLDSLDSNAITKAYTILLGLSSANSNGNFIRGETIYMSNTMVLSNISSQNVTGVVVSYDSTAPALINVAHIKGNFVVGSRIWGANSNASSYLTSVDEMTDIRQDSIIDNRRLEDEGTNIIDFSVDNPFGTP